MSLSRPRVAALAVASLSILAVAVIGSYATDSRPPVRPRRPTGGPVHGGVFYVAAPGDDVNVTPGERIFLPDVAVYLHNLATGVDSPPVKTDLFGRYFVPHHPPGRYELRWKAQSGWASGKHSDVVVIASGPRFPVPAQVRANRTGVVYGRVTLADGGTPWSYDELFGVNHAATVTILNAARTATLAGPVRTNAEGRYAAAGIARPQPATIRVQSQASVVTRAVSPSNIAMPGGSGISTAVQLPNRRPEIVSVVTQLGGVLAQTAAPGATISLVAGTRDLNGDPLQYEWNTLGGHGIVTPAAAGTASWTLPTVPGHHSAYLQISDGRGGFARRRIDFVTGRTDTTFSGRAVDKSSGAAVVKAAVLVNGRSATTDGNGFFRLKVALTDRYVLSIAREGFATFSRVLDSGATGQTWPLVKAQSQPVDPTQPIDLVDRRPELERKKQRGARIRIPANALVGPGGAAPTGPLTAYLATLVLQEGEAPGDWGALLGGSETNLISYGAAFVEFRDAGGTQYNLRPGQSAEVTMFPPSSMLPGAPPGARLWSYDEADGYWKESGASKFFAGAENFVGEVKHLSTINTDLEKDEAACLKVLIYPPIPTGVKLRVTDPTGSVFSQTFEFVLDAALNAVYRLPANTNVRLELLDADGTAYDGTVLLEETPGAPIAGNIVSSGPPIPPGSTLWPPEPYDTCKLVILREANEPTSTSFLSFKLPGSAAQAEAYYDVVDPDENGDGLGERETLGAWWSKNGFILGADGIPTNAVRTSYLNDNDLGSGRDMYFLQRPDGTVAAYVTNYGLFNQDHGNADLAADRDPPPGATVCMEYGPVAGQGTTRIVKFFVYAGADGGSNAPRQAGADLDTFGVKFVPNLCLNCHGGDYAPAVATAPTFTETNMGASFRELDIATYKFPDGRLVANAAEKAAFRQQNLIVKGAAAADTIAIQPIKDLIAGWYPGASDEQDNTFTPPGWVGAPQQALYHDVVKPSCRTCHVALDADASANGIGWISYDQLRQRQGFLDYYVLCQGRFMPHAVTTYRNFWLSGGPHRPAVLRDFANGSGWPAIGPCQ